MYFLARRRAYAIFCARRRLIRHAHAFAFLRAAFVDALRQYRLRLVARRHYAASGRLRRREAAPP